MAGPTTADRQRKRARFHPLTVRAVRRLTEDSIEVTFDVPEALADEYDFEPGQYLALRGRVAGRDMRRSYSICSSPVPGEVRVAIKRDIGGVFSSWANQSLHAGDVLEVMSPQGTFTTDIDPASTKHYAAVVAGSGVTPIMALTRSILNTAPHAKFSLLYSNRTAMDVMFLEELADLKDRYPSRFGLYHVLTREVRNSELMSGRLDAQRLALFLQHLLRPGDVDEWFLCGPFELVQLCRDTLAEAGVPRENVHFELFTTDRPEFTGPPPVLPIDEGAGVRTINFTLDGRTASITTAAHGRETILSAALRVRPDVPFACAGGVCGTCRAKLTAGTIEMDENYALEPEELAAGYILTCQSHPTSDSVSVNYDH
ncbi:phenylacetate-CoA oxygenase/reductase subunit PaaK [Parafrigoribacterium mesophilum]|uniref:1,2-phenylacetyl-CoA epoxidase subunit PaaE n=1 Tax=Parafrigoribacterium mesophilum TaxID=433646 RepID=UPI0031FBEA81